MARLWSCCVAAICATLVLAVSAQTKLELCVQEDVTPSQCAALERNNSPVKCRRVRDSASCAIDLAEGKAHFGVFTADELLLAHHFYPSGVRVVAELKSRDSWSDQFEFQSVVVVPKSYVPSENNFSGLIGSGLCHPGFSKTQAWNNHILKYFEQKVMNNVCRNDMTVAENEILNLRDFFKRGCRPGDWVSSKQFSDELKRKYPQMCELCDDKQSCQYTNKESHGHIGALDCLTSGRGQVAYASLHHVKDYFKPNQNKKISDYQYLCENGTVMPLDVQNPCTWFKQPWKTVLAKEDKADNIIEILKKSSSKGGLISSQSWEEVLATILFRKDSETIYDEYTSPAHYLSRGRDVELPKSDCGNNIRWCTVNKVETAKCNWTSAAALSLGIRPAISCVETDSPFQCFNKISTNDADIITIDSNYGHLARKVYGLAPILYSETTDELNSFVVAVVRDTSHSNRISSWNDLKNSQVCFPEYGGIAWLSFLNIARDNRLVSNSCKYPQIVAQLIKGACAPGFVESNHFLKNRKPKLNTEDLSKLCELCPMQNNGERCEANPENDYYGDKGALSCLREGSGNIAFLEARNLKALVENRTINQHSYRVLCKNGSLAEYTGFEVDQNCALSVTIDSEVVSRRDRPKLQLQDTTLALLKIEDWLGYRGDSERRLIHVYEPFNNTADLLFKDSTNGLVSTDSDVLSVIAYKELFAHLDSCTGGAATIAALFGLVIFNFILARLI